MSAPNQDLPKRFAKLVVRELATIRAEVEVTFVHLLRATGGSTAENKKRFNSIRSRRAKELSDRFLKELKLDGGDEG